MSKKLSEKQVQAITNLGRLFSDTTILLHEAIARKAGLTGTDHKYLGFLLQKGAMTAGEFSRITGLTTGAVTGLVDRLEKKKLARRQFDKEDRRKIIIVPNNDNATKLLGATFTDLQSRMVNLISTFSDREIDIIEKYLNSTIDIMKDVTSDINNKLKVKR